jgi:hypothetical protein
MLMKEKPLFLIRFRKATLKIFRSMPKNLFDVEPARPVPVRYGADIQPSLETEFSRLSAFGQRVYGRKLW